MEPIASVIIPVYNAQQTLRRCVESVVLGVERNVQVILVEDCSGDGSWEVCQMLAREFENVSCIRNRQNRGVSFARNQGLAAARGQHVLFVDSDDWVSGTYVQAMVKLAEKHPDALPVCGYHFVDRVHDLRQTYTWDENKDAENSIQPDRFFDLAAKGLLKTLWNKVFCRDMIEKAGLRFDETQSMGEDYQFVLDYMEAAKIRSCVVCNQPLYYYVRHNTNSLMSKFGLIQTRQELCRVQQLYRLTGQTDPARRDQMLQNTQNSFLYHISRNRTMTKAEKLERIENIMEDNRASAHYARKLALFRKEKLTAVLQKGKTLPGYIQKRLQRDKCDARIRRARRQLLVQDVTVISQNCIGGVFYHDMGLPFSSPTVDLFFDCGDFVRFVADLPRYLAVEPEMYWGEEYPMGKLGNITLHFMHYDTCQEAKAAWKRRRERIAWDKILVLCTDMEGFTDTVFAQWKQLPYHKVLFTANKAYSREPDSVYFPHFQEKVPDLIPGRLFYRDGALISAINGIQAGMNRTNATK